MRAFRELPEDHTYQQAILKLCQGVLNKEAGIYASNMKPRSVEQAIDTIKWHIHSHNTIYGKQNRRDVRLVQGPAKREVTPVACRASTKPASPIPTWRSDMKAFENRVRDQISGIEGRLMGEIRNLVVSCKLATPQKSPNDRELMGAARVDGSPGIPGNKVTK